jgi:hypothetical protein
MISLPRQARDKHIGKTQKQERFSSVCGRPLPLPRQRCVVLRNTLTTPSSLLCVLFFSSSNEKRQPFAKTGSRRPTAARNGCGCCAGEDPRGGNAGSVALQNMHLIFGFVESFAQGGKEGRKEGRMDNPSDRRLFFASDFPVKNCEFTKTGSGYTCQRKRFTSISQKGARFSFWAWVHRSKGRAAAREPRCTKRLFGSHFYIGKHDHDHFTKTGSGQT